MYNNNIPQNLTYIPYNYKNIRNNNNNNNDRVGFLGPFILGGIAGTLISPRLNNNYPIYYPTTYPIYQNNPYQNYQNPIYMPYPYR